MTAYLHRLITPVNNLITMKEKSGCITVKYIKSHSVSRTHTYTYCLKLSLFMRESDNCRRWGVYSYSQCGHRNQQSMLYSDCQIRSH